jgi:hypothetical protein
MACEYVCAGFETLSSIIDKFTLENDNFTKQQVSEFFSKTCNKFLHSFGGGVSGRKSFKNYAKSEAELLQKCRSTGLFDQSMFYVDSGGYQVSVGQVSANQVDDLIECYHNFLLEYSNVFDRAFTLDIPPGPRCTAFSSFDEVYELNLKSYLKAASLPDDVRSKLIYVHHFRTPKLWEVYSRILEENDLFPKFSHFGTGGIVATKSSGIGLPCIIYVIPLIVILKHALSCGMKELDFHVLGGSTYRDIITYEILKIHIEKRLGIKVNITYDSSGVFKGFLIARNVHHLTEDGTIITLCLKSSMLEFMVKETKKTVLQTFLDLLEQMAAEYNFKPLNRDTIYDEKGALFKDVAVYSMLYVLRFFSLVENYAKKISPALYDLYEKDPKWSFGPALDEVMIKVNYGKRTKKQEWKTSVLARSLELLEDLQTNNVRKVVEQYLSSDEFTNLLKEDEYYTL